MPAARSSLVWAKVLDAVLYASVIAAVLTAYRSLLCERSYWSEFVENWDDRSNFVRCVSTSPLNCASSQHRARRCATRS